MSYEHDRPSFVGDERAQLAGWLDLQRKLVSWKCSGLSDADAYRVVVPTSPLMTVAGIVSHLRYAEATWFDILFLGTEAVGPQFSEDPEDLDMMPQGIPIAQLVGEYEQQWALSNEIVAQHELDEVGRHPDFQSARGSLRWMLVHMIEETARHVGHLDLIRELLDGETGYY